MRLSDDGDTPISIISFVVARSLPSGLRRFYGMVRSCESGAARRRKQVA